MNKLKYIIRDFKFLKVLFSPFKPFKLDFYFGKISRGVPYFYPRKWVKSKDKSGYLEAKSIKWFGFNYCTLGYKTKWSDTDYRFEWSPTFSFVFLKMQFCITVVAPECSNYWESWLYYENHTDKSKSKNERIKQCIKEFPQKYTRTSMSFYKNTVEKSTVNYYNYILKEKYKKYII